jgi:deazaflavin-dependent oxidoreductase (nitroreductase family)
MGLRHVDPLAERGGLYDFFLRFARSRPGQAWGRHVSPRIDPLLYRATGGRYPAIIGSVLTAPLLTIGAKTGESRESQLAYFHDSVDVVLVASNYGGDRHPSWYHNLRANPRCRFGNEHFMATQVTDQADYDRLFALATRVYPGYSDYAVRTRAVGRTIPILRLAPVD